VEARVKHSISCHAFRPLRRNTLFGFATIKIVELDLEIRDVAIHQKGRAGWSQLPSKAQVKDGELVKDHHGKIQHWPMMDFTSSQIRDAFSRAVINAVLRAFPNAFEDGEIAA